MIMRSLFPGFAPAPANLPEVFIARMRWSLTVAMLPNFGILLRRNDWLALPFYQRVIAAPFVISPVSRNLLDVSVGGTVKLIAGDDSGDEFNR